MGISNIELTKTVRGRPLLNTDGMRFVPAAYFTFTNSIYVHVLHNHAYWRRT
jgi:hypothetical protein